MRYDQWGRKISGSDCERLDAQERAILRRRDKIIMAISKETNLFFKEGLRIALLLNARFWLRIQNEHKAVYFMNDLIKERGERLWKLAKTKEQRIICMFGIQGI